MTDISFAAKARHYKGWREMRGICYSHRELITSLRNQVREREVRYDDLLERYVALLERNEALLEALYNSSDVSFPY